MLERLIASIEAEEKNQQIKDERFVREQRILDESAPRLWQSLRAALKAESEKYPKHFTFRIGPDSEAVIIGKKKVLEIQYLKESKTIAFSCDGSSGECPMRIDERNLPVICDTEGLIYSSTREAAERLLSLVL